MTNTVRQLVNETGYPNMKVLQFGFDKGDIGYGNDYLPHNYGHNCVVYTGTHDNDTILHWALNCDKKTAKYAMKYTGVKKRTDHRWLVPGLRRRDAPPGSQLSERLLHSGR